jgi:photosystem II stability/assembly factor-like uncharacterized protein
MTTLIGTVDGIHDLDGGGGAVALAGRAVTDLTTQWALTDGDTLWRTGADGNWTEVIHLDGPDPATCLLAVDDGVLVGTRGAHLLRVRAEGLDDVPGFEALPARADWYTPWGGPADVRSLAEGDGVAYVNVHVGGIARSGDGGRTWTATPLDIHTDVHQVVAVPGRVLAAAGDGGLLSSTDGGDTWHQDTDGLHATYARAVAVAGDTVLLTASTGPRTRQAAVYRRPLAGGTFERCEDGLPGWFTDNIDTRCLAAHGDEAVFGTADGRVYRSSDAGVTWHQAAADLPRVTAVAM